VSAQTLPANCDRTAMVAPNDTCNIISAQYNVSTYQLAAVNAGLIDANCDNLAVGEGICLGLTGQDCTETYVVQSGDTCVEIADTYNITESTLLTNNPNLNAICTNLYPDEVLCVSSTIYVNLTQAA
ncbi:carbohydrate-binding module family 50 protein, partial [Hydnomerulius pinastri MD-312]